jgi:glycosyltransferase involved in cell wall biosynthesis
MKIGLIGNMNNNNFSMMRYFRDLGADAHLLLYSNDGKGTLSHFTPEADTWEIEKWSPFIHQTDIPNAPVAAFDFPHSSVVGLRSELRRIIGSLSYSTGAVTRAQILRAYTGYDRLIASGLTPATLARIDRSLDLFYPYSMGVEFFDCYEFTAEARGPWHRRMVYNALRRKQLNGLLRARCVVSLDREVTGKALAQVGVKSIQQTTPMVYNREVPPEIPPTCALADVEFALRGSGISLLHHARLMWKEREGYSADENMLSTKNSDWLIRAFATFTTARPSLSPRLFIVEYGPDVEATKNLVTQLGIQESVSWLPKMERRELMWILSRVTIGVGEFYNSRCMIWGGTGWEALASGKPLLQAFRFEEGEFESLYGYLPPPMLPVRTEEDLLKQLLFVADHPEKAAQIGERAREWFDTHNGIALAGEWLDLLSAPTASVESPVSRVL